ncbi:MAG: hypothetical protein NTY01_16750 [Verrucomicrobia bacterium]|nr:hypothetical protein [Verrucomicrobiota bacterium]
MFRRYNGGYYYEDTETGKQLSLGTKNRSEAQQGKARKANANKEPEAKSLQPATNSVNRTSLHG